MIHKSHMTAGIYLFLAGTAVIFSLLFFAAGKEQSEPAETEAVKLEILETEEYEKRQETERSEAVEDAAAVLEQESQRITALSAGEAAAEGMVDSALLNRLFYAAAIDDEITARINGSSYTENENIRLSELSYLRMLYYGFDGNTYVGEMIVNQKIEAEILQIFQTLYENRYPIERMVLIDEYGADDESSMRDNNTSAFNYRTIAGSGRLSRHSFGMAVDLNPKYNPYVKRNADGSIFCQPETGIEYADRTKDSVCRIDETDLAYQLFTQAGFTWGGSWSSVKDYQHFEKTD